MESDLEDNFKEEEPYGLGCALESFKEREEIEKLIDNLPNLINADRSVVEKAYERFFYIFGLYTEQPHLLDPHVDDILEKFIKIIRHPNTTLDVKHICFKYMFVLVNVRGYKIIVRHLPHEVSDFEPVLQLLELQNPKDASTWTTRYILLLWLSIIVMIPFHMTRLDGTSDDKGTVTERVTNIVKKYIIVADKCRDAAAYLSARFFTRSDMKDSCLPAYFEWAMESSLKESDNIFMKNGTLTSVAMILKHAKREDILPHARNLLQWIIDPKFKIKSGINVVKLVFKIVQRIGLMFLPPRIATWRYKRGNRSLTANLSAGDTTANSELNAQSDKEEENSVIDVPEEVEEIIDQLIQGLGNSEGIVRWSAAKGIGRVTSRLPKDLADEVVGSVLQLFNPRESDSAWHGGCIALAELGRRGLLLPQRLPEVVPLIVKALVYDEPRGYSSVGSHIRDSACYVCWSFARAYDTHVLQPYVREIASTLLIVACFDREINCRRAASAAFQENVGRQGTFPHGITILTYADFFAVSVRTNSYLQISKFIAQYEEYTVPLLNHLVERKVDHWDIIIRELTAKALHNLTPLAPEYMVKNVLPKLFEKAYSIDLNARHGSILSLGEIVHALSLLAKERKEKIDDYIKNLIGDDYEEIENKIKGIVPTYRERFYYRGLGGELMRQACCDLIDKCSISQLPFHNQEVLADWLNLLNECIPYDLVNLRLLAIKALPSLLEEYFTNSSQEEKMTLLIDEYLKQLRMTNVQITRMGHALALGALPLIILKPHLDSIITALIEASSVTAATLKWSEARRDCVKGLTNIIVTLGNQTETSVGGHLQGIVDTCMGGLKDYAQDKRGDIGAWMREASMLALETLVKTLSKNGSKYLNTELITKILANVGQQAVEKIDRTRVLAGTVFCNIIFDPNIKPFIVHYDHLLIIFPEKECARVNWNSSSVTFPKFVQLLKFPEFTYNLLLGLICSVGGLTESLVKESSSSLFAYLKVEKKHKGVEEIRRLCNVVYEIFLNHQKNDRVTVVIFRFLDKLMESGCVDCVIHDDGSDFAMKMLKLVQMELSGCKDVYKLIDGISALSQFIQIKNEVCDMALVQLSILLCHRQSYVRRTTANKLYESLLVNGENSNINPEKLDDVLQVLSNTVWEDPIEVIKPIRNELCKLMGVRVPTPKVKKNT